MSLAIHSLSRAGPRTRASIRPPAPAVGWIAGSSPAMTTKADGEHESLSSAAARSAGHGRPGDAIRNPITGRRILLQTIDTETDGLTPSDREWLSNVRLMYNKESGDYLVLVSKNIPIDEIDWEAFNEAMRPIVREIGRPRNHGQSQSGLEPDREWALINVRRMVK